MTRTFVLAIALVASLAGQAQSLVEPWTEGEHYHVIPIPVATGSEKIVVSEFFSYACIHCFSFDPLVEAWVARQEADVEFERVPAVFNRQWQLFAQAFHVAQACNVLEQTHGPLFEALHVERTPLLSPEAISGFYAEVVEGDDGCSSAQDFLDVFQSFGVSAATQQSLARGRAYQATGVPTMIVDGRFRVSGRTAGSNEAMLQVVDFLVRRIRLERETPAG